MSVFLQQHFCKAQRASLHGRPEPAWELCPLQGTPPTCCLVQNMWDRFLALAVVPVDTPLPMSMLRRLWGLNSDADAEATGNLLNQLGVLKIACLTDNSAWALVQPGHLKALHVRPGFCSRVFATMP